MPEDRTATAIHEAGHAVVAHFVGQPVEYVTIVPDDDAGSKGHVRNSSDLPTDEDLILFEPDTQRWIENYTEATWAGPLAEARYVGHVNDVGAGFHDGEFASGSDYDHIAEFALRVNGSGAATEAWIAWTKCRAEAQVERLWPQIEAIAQALLEHDTLTGDQVADLIWQSLTGKLAA